MQYKDIDPNAISSLFDKSELFSSSFDNEIPIISIPKRKSVLTPDQVKRVIEELFGMRQIYTQRDGKNELSYYHNRIIIMLQAKVGAYSAAPFLTSVLSKAIHASFLFADYLPKDLAYKKLYLNLIFAGTSFLGSLIHGYGLNIRAKNLYMRAHYERCEDLVKLCYQVDFIKDLNGNFNASPEIMLIREVLLRTWKRIFENNGYTQFSEFEEAKIMDCTLNILNSLILKFADLKQARLDQDLILSEGLKIQIIDELSDLISQKIQSHNSCSNITCLHLPSYKSFIEVPSINTFSVLINQIFYEHLSGRSQSFDVTEGSSSTNVKVPRTPHASALNATYYGDGGFVKSKLFYKIKKESELSELLKDSGKAIYEKAGSKSKIRAHHLLHLVSGFIKTIPFFDSFDENKNAPPWLKCLVGGLAFIVSWMLDVLFKHIDSSYYNYRNEYDKFKENVIDLIHREILVTDGQKSISSKTDNFPKIKLIIAKVIDRACQAHGKTYQDLSEADLGFISAKLFNCLIKILKAEHECNDKRILIPTTVIEDLVVQLSNDLQKSLSNSKLDKAGKGRISGLVVTSGLKETNVCAIICNSLSNQLSKEQIDYILKINQSSSKSVREGGITMPLTARDADVNVKASIERDATSTSPKKLFAENVSRASVIARDGSNSSGGAGVGLGN